MHRVALGLEGGVVLPLRARCLQGGAKTTGLSRATSQEHEGLGWKPGARGTGASLKGKGVSAGIRRP